MPSLPDMACVRGVPSSSSSPRDVAREFRERVVQAPLKPSGNAQLNPTFWQRPAYLPVAKVSLFRAHYYLAPYRHDDSLNFFVGYVASSDFKPRAIYPRIFYKDSSLVWRVASHFIEEEGENWIGKGDVRWEHRPDGDYLVSAEETTDLPYEIQDAFDQMSQLHRRGKDQNAVPDILRRAPRDRIQPYADFSRPRERARVQFAINQGRRVASLKDRHNPRSLQFSKGFKPDYRRIIESTSSVSRLYGGDITKFRVLSKNQLIQYQFVVSPTHVWVNPPQALTTELTSYGIRAHHVESDDNVFLPGYEYHYLDEAVDPPEFVTQVPEGYVGEPSDVDPTRADVSPWLRELPIIRGFVKEVLKGRHAYG